MKTKIKTESGPDAYNVRTRVGKIKDENGRTVGGRRGIYSESTGELLGIHSLNYGHVQYADLKEVTDNAILISDLGVEREQIDFSSTLYQSSQCGVETGGEVLDNETGARSPITLEGAMGGRATMKWRIPTFQQKEIVTGDALSFFFEIDSSHDGGWAITQRTGIERVACLNGWVKEDTVKKSKFKHTKYIDVQMLVHRINESLDVFKEGVRQYGTLFVDMNDTAINHYEGLNMITNMGFQKKDKENILSLWKQPYQWRGYTDDRRPAQAAWNRPEPGFDSIELDGQRWKRPQIGSAYSSAKVGDLFNCITQHLTHTCKSRLYAAQKGRKAFNDLIAFVGRDRDSKESLRLTCEAPPITRNRTKKEVNPLVVTQDAIAEAEQFPLF